MVALMATVAVIFQVVFNIGPPPQISGLAHLLQGPISLQTGLHNRISPLIVLHLSSHHHLAQSTMA